ncbi:MAG: hypothetical protein AAFW83_10850 [Pseudomonadota bacterium]
MSTSEQRKRKHGVTFRVDDRELEELRHRADRASLTLAGFARSSALDEPPPRQSRRTPVDHQKLAQVLAGLGNLRGNVNQMAHQMNMHHWPGEQNIEEAINDIHDMRELLMRALNNY